MAGRDCRHHPPFGRIRAIWIGTEASGSMRSKKRVMPMRRRGKRLRGLDESVRPSFVVRMDRVRRQRERVFAAMLISALLTGAAIGWTLF